MEENKAEQEDVEIRLEDIKAVEIGDCKKGHSGPCQHDVVMIVAPSEDIGTGRTFTARYDARTCVAILMQLNVRLAHFKRYEKDARRVRLLRADPYTPPPSR